MKPVLLAITLLTDEHRAQIEQSFELIYALEPAQIADAIAAGRPLLGVPRLGRAGFVRSARSARCKA